jgi:RNA polymerase sigma-70 factor (ECF subfamily)
MRVNRDVIAPRGASLEELEALYRRRFPIFARVAASVAGDPERARDAVQEGFATAVRKRASFRGTGPLEAWVWRIVLNSARSDARKRTPTTTEPDPYAGTNGDHAIGNGHSEHDFELRDALARLPERQRTAVFLRYYADLDYAAIGEALGIAEGTVAATLNAAHAALRNRLQEVRA